MTRSIRSFWLRLLLPLVVLLLLSLLLTGFDLDRGFARLFYQPPNQWPHAQELLPQVLYHYGMFPGVGLALAGLLVLLLSSWLRQLRVYWRPASFLLLLALLGPGLLVHNLGKEMWGRPRPVDSVDFGGDRPYHDVFSPAGAALGKSFPSGHAAIGFFMIAPYFILRRRCRRQAWLWLGGGILYGGLMGVGRMAQGGHYLTDILWSLYCVYFTGCLLEMLLHPGDFPQSEVV